MRRRLTPARALVLSFLVMITAGTALLRLPGVTVPGRELAWHEALFRATSAVCVTGLVVRQPGDFTPLGQALTAVLFQLGGIGILTFGLVFMVLLGGRMSFFGRELAQGTLGRGPWEDFWPLLRGVVVVTVLFEGAGAAVLALGWAGEMGIHRAVWWGIYHAVSAFCNAGFGLHPDSLGPWRGDPLLVGTVLALLVLGGIGFLPLTEIHDRWRARRRRPLSLHTRLALAVTATLLAGGTLAILALEWHGALAGLSPGTRLLDAVFQAATPRTAGFSTLDLAAYTPAGLLLTMVLMFVGASPGSTGGGIKTTTLGVLVAAQVSRARGQRQVSAWGRAVPGEVLGSAVSLALSGIVVVVAATIVVAHLERLAGSVLGTAVHLVDVAFEVVSAFGTVGLSTGITAQLTVPSRLVLVVLMFVGRVGPLTFGLALLGRRRHRDWRYPTESVMVG